MCLMKLVSYIDFFSLIFEFSITLYSFESNLSVPKSFWYVRNTVHMVVMGTIC